MIRPGHGADVGAPVAPQLRLVMQAAQAHALELAAQRARDRLTQRGLAHARRPDEAQDRRLRLGVELQDRQVLEDPLLDLLEVEVILVEHPLSLVEIQVVFRGLAPGKLEDEFEIGAGDLVIGGGRRQSLQSGPARARTSLWTSSGRSAAIRRSRSSWTSARSRIGLSQLALNGPELLAEQVLALLLAHLVLGLARDLLPQLQHLELVSQVAMDQPERLGAGGCLEQGLLLGHVQTHHRPDEKGQNQRIGRLGRKLVDIDPSLRVRQLQRAGRQVEHGAAQGLDLRSLVLRERQRAYTGLEIRLGLIESDQLHPFHALDQELDPGRGAGHLLDDGPGAHGIEVVGCRQLHLRVLAGPPPGTSFPPWPGSPPPPPSRRAVRPKAA